MNTYVNFKLDMTHVIFAQSPTPTTSPEIGMRYAKRIVQNRNGMNGRKEHSNSSYIQFKINPNKVRSLQA